MKRHFFYQVLLLLGLLVLFPVVGHVAALDYPLLDCDIQQLSNNDYDDSSPQISGNHVVWYGSDGHDDEIYLWDGSTVQNISNNDYDDIYPQISGSNVVWFGSDGHDSEIYYWDGSTVQQLTDNSLNDLYPDISGSNVVWFGIDYDSNDNIEIYYWDGSTVQNISNNDYYDDLYPQISGSHVTWQANDAFWTSNNDNDIYYWDGSTVQQLTNNDYDDLYPQISGSNVVWYGSDGHDSEIYLWDGSTVQNISNNDYDDLSPQISGSNVVWYGSDGHDSEIYLWDGSTVQQLTNNDYGDWFPQISGSNIVWEGYDGHDWEIYLWDGSTVQQLTNNDHSDGNMQISGSNVVWEGYDGHDDEIYFVDTNTCTIANTAPTANANGPYHVDEGDVVSLSGTGTDAEDSSLSFAWDLDNDGLFETASNPTLFSADDGPATLTVAFQVCDSHDLCTSDSSEVTVNNVAPSGILINSYPVTLAGETTMLLVTHVSDPSLADMSAGFSYAIDCLGDGTMDAAPGTNPLFTCSYPDAGNFTATAQIIDKDGAIGTAELTVRVLSPTEAAAEIAPIVEELASNGRINRGQANSLLSKLEHIQASLARGNTDSALNQIDAFINEVEAMVARGELTPDEGDELIYLALRIQYSIISS